MNRLIIVFLAVIAIIVGLFIVMPKSLAEQALTFPGIETQLQNGSKLVDVRTAEEYAQSHIVNSINLPLSNIQSGDFGSLEKTIKNYVYCHSGNRATQATDILQKAGYEIVNLGAMSHVADIGGTVCTNC